MDYVTRDTNDHRPKFGILCPINTNTFPGKLWKLVNDENCHSVSWNNSGSGIFINPKLFTAEVLHCEEFAIFKTQNFSSFVRQLNLYGFRKLTISNKMRYGESVSKDMQMNHFQHPCFLKSRPDMLNQVKRAGARKRSREFDFHDESRNISPSYVRKSEGVSAFSGWGLSSKSLAGSSSFRKRLSETKQRIQLSPLLNSQRDTDILEFSPVRDILQPMISSSLILREDQHPYRKAENGLPCDLRLTWMTNVAKGSLTSGESGISPETVFQNGHLKRLVLIPDELDSFSPELQVPSSQFLESFLPKAFHPNDMLNTISSQPSVTSTIPIDSAGPRTTVSWSRSSPIPTTGYETPRFLDSEDSAVCVDWDPHRDGDFESQDASQWSMKQELQVQEGMRGLENSPTEGAEEDEQVIVIKVEPDDSFY